MGKFASAVKNGPPRTGHWCVVCDFLETLDEESRSEAKAMIADKSWSNVTLVNTFAVEGCGGDNIVMDVHRKSRAARG